MEGLAPAPPCLWGAPATQVSPNQASPSFPHSCIAPAACSCARAKTQSYFCSCFLAAVEILLLHPRHGYRGEGSTLAQGSHSGGQGHPGLKQPCKPSSQMQPCSPDLDPAPQCTKEGHSWDAETHGMLTPTKAGVLGSGTWPQEGDRARNTSP